MTESQNGWRVLDADQLRAWRIPARKGDALHYPHGGPAVILPLAHRPAGFLLVHFALWFHERVESLTAQPQRDEWGWAPRNIIGSSTISNHASGTAMDLNATRHPLGVPTMATFTPRQVRAIRRRLRLYRGCLRWGGDFQTRPDAMHVEVNASKARVEAVARVLRHTPRGRRVTRLNPVLR